LERGRVRPPVHLARADDCTTRYVTRILKLAYLAPDIIEAILAGRQPCDLSLARLLKTDLPLDWQAQRQALGF
jgi:site-specific DNA recombinase